MHKPIHATSAPLDNSRGLHCCNDCWDSTNLSNVTLTEEDYCGEDICVSTILCRACRIVLFRAIQDIATFA